MNIVLNVRTTRLVLRALNRANRLTQKEVADATGLSQTAVSNFMSEDVATSERTACVMQQFLADISFEPRREERRTA